MAGWSTKYRIIETVALASALSVDPWYYYYILRMFIRVINGNKFAQCSHYISFALLWVIKAQQSVENFRGNVQLKAPTYGIVLMCEIILIKCPLQLHLVPTTSGY